MALSDRKGSDKAQIHALSPCIKVPLENNIPGGTLQYCEARSKTRPQSMMGADFCVEYVSLGSFPVTSVIKIRLSIF